MNPPNFLAESKRRNVIRVAGLYLVGAWLLVQVARTLQPVFETALGDESPNSKMSTDEQRKVPASMFTDMVGYSALSQRDEKLATELLEEHRRLLREIFPRFNGTEIKTIGDAFLVEFGSEWEGAQCAIEIQRNADIAPDQRQAAGRRARLHSVVGRSTRRSLRDPVLVAGNR